MSRAGGGDLSTDPSHELSTENPSPTCTMPVFPRHRAELAAGTSHYCSPSPWSRHNGLPSGEMLLACSINPVRFSQSAGPAWSTVLRKILRVFWPGRKECCAQGRRENQQTDGFFSFATLGQCSSLSWIITSYLLPCLPEATNIVGLLLSPSTFFLQSHWEWPGQVQSQ